MSTVKTSNLQLGISEVSSENFHWKNNLDGSLSLMRGDVEDASPVEVLAFGVNNSATFAEAISGGVFGTGQSWVNVTGQRAGGVTYTNTTDKPIIIAPAFQHGGSQFFVAEVLVNGVLVCAVNAGDATYSQVFPVFIIVPAGATYRASVTAGGGGLSAWREFR